MNEARDPSPKASGEGARRPLRVVGWLLVVVAVVALATPWLLPRLDAYATDGEIAVGGLEAPVRVVRDERGMAYLYAETWDDAFFAQGWVTAQDRLFQLHLFRLASQGRLTELAGERARDLDVRRRTLGFHHLAKEQARRLAPESRRSLERFAAGVNAYIDDQSGEHPLAFRLAGLEPEAWDVDDTLSILFYFGWNSAANLRHELVAQGLVDALGAEAARSLFPLNFNPDDADPHDAELDEATLAERTQSVASARRGVLGLDDPLVRGLVEISPRRFGSNNWAVRGSLSASGRPVVANDPHLDPRTLPGIWYPIGLVVGEERVVGASVPGAPGVTIGRNRHLAWAVTNAYADTQDLFVETLDPESPHHYLEARSDGGAVLSVPFETRTEILRIRDDESDGGFREEAIEVRSTRRGPVVSGVLGGADDGESDRVLSLGWTAASSIDPEIGMDRLFRARSFEEADAAVREIDTISLNYVWASTDGRLGWRVSGRVPRRAEGAGILPWPVEMGSAWQGWIPPEEMPHATSGADASRRWLGTANHYTVTTEQDGYFTNYASPSYRYRRLRQLLDADGPLDVDDHWRLQRDATNLMARSLAPILADALAEDAGTADLSRLLAEWDHVDAADRPEPLIFQAIYRRFALETFRDELGEVKAAAMLEDWYFWQERFERMVLAGESEYFDDGETAAVESRDDLIRRAGAAVLRDLEERLGDDPESWCWGALHRLEFRDPLLRGDGLLAGLLGGGSHAMGGSGETLLRGWYDFGDPFGITHTASLRMVIDLGDEEKIRAVLPGGVTERLFHPHRKDQIDEFLGGEPVHWWWSDEAIAAHAASELRLTPGAR